MDRGPPSSFRTLSGTLFEGRLLRWPILDGPFPCSLLLSSYRQVTIRLDTSLINTNIRKGKNIRMSVPNKQALPLQVNPGPSPPAQALLHMHGLVLHGYEDIDCHTIFHKRRLNQGFTNGVLQETASSSARLLASVYVCAAFPSSRASCDDNVSE